jgi:ATP/maltotriose-dependent transcriptional regulator MalT
VTLRAVSPEMEAGRDALARGAWLDAKAAFEGALARRESPEALEGLGTAAWWLDHGDSIFETRERAYSLYRRRGDNASAARMATWIAWDYAAFRGETAVASGWLRRARRLLEGVPEGPEHAWLALREGAFALLEHGDPREALERSQESIRIGRAIESSDYEMLGRALAGFAKVTAGEVADGMRDLDEVNAAVLAGELRDPLLIGLACCYLIAACERVRDFDRAVQWCTRLKAFCEKWGLRPLFSVCRTQYASVCMWRGTWNEADEELTLATEELRVSRPAMTGEGLVRLAELRRRQGRLEESAELFTRAESHPQASLGLAEIALDRGDARTAADLSERYLRRFPEDNRIERAAGLELHVRARLNLGQTEEARRALDSLIAIAAQVGTLPLLASARLAAGLVAEAQGDLESARRAFEDAVDRFQQSGAPFETALARIALARALAALGRADESRAEAERALEALLAMHAENEIARVRGLLADVETSPGASSGGAAAGPESGAKRRVPSLLTEREREVLRLVAQGMTNQAIAERLFVSEHTVHRHIANILRKLDAPSRAAAVARAAREDLLRNP